MKRLAMDQIDGLQRKVQEMLGMMDTLRHPADECCGDHRPDCPILFNLGLGAEPGIAVKGAQGAKIELSHNSSLRHSD